jgi:hypothetical protein
VGQVAGVWSSLLCGAGFPGWVGVATGWVGRGPARLITWCEKARVALSAEQSAQVCCVGGFGAVQMLQERCLGWCVEFLGFTGLGKLFQVVWLPGL